MENFSYFNETNIIFGKDTHHDVGKYLKDYGAHKVLVHYGSKHAKESGLIKEITDSISKHGLEFIELGGVQPNPRDSLVYKGIEIAKENKIDFILAVGGGSVIDSAKAIAIGYYYDGDILEIYKSQKYSGDVLPIGVVLTISAAGSESSTNSVITFEKEGIKRGFACLKERPKFAVLNPELTYSLPDYHLHAGIVDIMAHLLERYFSPSKDVYVSKAMIEGVLHSIIHDIVPRLGKDRKDYGANANLMWAGTLAHNNILGCDRVQDWGTHRLSYELSYKYDAIHGAAIAVLFPAWMKYNYYVNEDLFVDFAIKIIGVKEQKTKNETIFLGISEFEKFLKNELEMPTCLEDLGASEKDIPEFVEKIFEPNQKPTAQFNPFTKESVEKIYKLALKK